jgi:DNA transformation protein
MRLSELKNLGARSEEWLPKVGIYTAEQLRASDPYEVYAKLKATVPGTSLNALYAILGAMEDRHWLEIKRERRTEVLLRLDAMGLAP